MNRRAFLQLALCAVVPMRLGATERTQWYGYIPQGWHFAFELPVRVREYRAVTQLTKDGPIPLWLFR